MTAPAKDVETVMRLLQSMGVNNYEPRVVNMLLECSHRYVAQVLKDARTFSEFAGRQNINLDDVKLAVQSRVDSSFTQPPPREFMATLARSKNSVPLPPLEFRAGLRLPAEGDCLTENTTQMPTAAEQPQSMDFAASQSLSSYSNGINSANINNNNGNPTVFAAQVPHIARTQIQINAPMSMPSM